MKGSKISGEDYAYHQDRHSHFKDYQRDDQSFVNLCCTSIKEGIEQIKACFSSQDRQGSEGDSQRDKDSINWLPYLIAIVLFVFLFFYFWGFSTQIESSNPEQTVQISQPFSNKQFIPSITTNPQETSKAIPPKTEPPKSPIPQSPFIDQLIKANSLLKLSPYLSSPSKEDLQVAQKFWLFVENEKEQSYFDTLMTSNNRYFAEESGFKFHVVSFSNYQDHLNQEYKQKISKIMKILRDRIKLPEYKENNLKYHIYSVEKRLAMLAILYHQGGVMASERVIITETFQWIRRIRDEVLVNRANNNEPPQVFAFHSSYYSQVPSRQKLMPREGLQEVDHQFITSPALQGYFIAAKPQAAYIRDLFNTIIQFMQDPSMAQNDLKNYIFTSRRVRGGDIYYEYFVLASLKVIQMKQKYLDSIYEKETYRQYAIDYYGLETINCRYSPFKISTFWEKITSERLFQFMARTTLTEYYTYAGPVRYLEKSKMGNDLSKYIENVKNGQDKKGIMRGSYLQKVFYPKSRQNFIYDNTEKQIIHYLAKPWDIPKIIWIYSEKGILNENLVNKLSHDNIKRYGEKSGFVLNEVNTYNIDKYLTKDTINKIQMTIDKAKTRSTFFAEMKSYLIRLALLEKHGGVYIDLSNILLDNLDWLIKIGQYPSDYVMNRYGEVPNVLTFWDPLDGSPVDWKIDPKGKVKSQWHLSYQNNFIAAVKDSEFISSWLNMYLKFATLTYQDIEKQLKICRVFNYRLTKKDNFEGLAVDAAKCVVGLKQQELIQKKETPNSNACEYYKLWSLNSYLGELKFRYNSNVEDEDVRNPILYYRYPKKYTETYSGPINHFIKLNEKVKDTFNDLIIRSSSKNISTYTHSDSIFIQYLINKTVIALPNQKK